MIGEKQRFEAALRSSTPAKALRSLVLELSSEGHGKQEWLVQPGCTIIARWLDHLSCVVDSTVGSRQRRVYRMRFH